MVVLKNKALLSITLAGLLAAGLLVAALLVAAANPAGAAFPGTNGKIALSSNRGNVAADYDIYTLTTGGGATPLTAGNMSNAIYDIDKDPNYSADGTKIAFSSNRNNPVRTNYSIWTMNADDGSNLRRETPDGNIDQTPAWAPNGQQIAFERAGKIYKLTLGGGETPVTDVGTADRDPNWSPNGEQIVFERAGDIVTVNANVKNDTMPRVTGVENDTDPNWSPNGQQIVFVRGPAGAGDIYKYTLGGSTTPVVTGVSNDTNPAYSPDGQQIVFDRGNNIYTANANGGAETPVPNGPGTEPDWGVSSPGPTPTPTPTGCTKTGGPGSDDLVGTSGADKLCGLDGDDTLRGRQGNDELLAGPGTDQAYGGKGPDSINTQDGVGGDLANGGKGTDNCTTDPGDTQVSC